MKYFHLGSKIFRSLYKSDTKCSRYLISLNIPRNHANFYCTKPSHNPLKKPTKSINVAGYFMLSIPVATFCLGTWQVKRRQWKLNLIESLNQRLSKSPIDLPMDLEELKDLEYRRVVLRGTFDHQREQYIMPRTCRHSESDSSRGLLSSSKHNGSYVITPFQLADRNLTVLINRGWVPKNQTLPNTRPEGQIPGEIEIEVIYRKPEKRLPFMPKNNPQKGFWHWRDVTSMAEKLDVEPIFFDAVAKTTVPGGPIGGQTNVSLRNEHFSYIITWYSLSAITSYLWYKRYIKRLALM